MHDERHDPVDASHVAEDGAIGSTAPVGRSVQLHVTSRDGVDLLVERRGHGESVIFVHGTVGDRADWASVATHLADRYETNVMDRRGRGGSGDASDHSMDREIDDVLAVIDACDAPVHLVGHSFGAIVALLAAARDGSALASLVLDEPPIATPPSDELGDEHDGAPRHEPAERSNDGAVLADRLDALVAANELDAAVRTFVAAANGTADHLDDLPAAVREALRGAVRSAGREIRAASSMLPLPAAVVETIATRCLVLLGDEQHLPTYAGVRALADRLPNATIATVPGGHLAHLEQPQTVAAIIATFLAST